MLLDGRNNGRGNGSLQMYCIIHRNCAHHDTHLILYKASFFADYNGTLVECILIVNIGLLAIFFLLKVDYWHAFDDSTILMCL